MHSLLMTTKQMVDSTTSRSISAMVMWIEAEARQTAMAGVVVKELHGCGGIVMITMTLLGPSQLTRTSKYTTSELTCRRIATVMMTMSWNVRVMTHFLSKS